MEGEEEQTLTKNYCWHTALNRAIRKNKREAHNRYLQLATVRNDGSPAVRTLVFRKFQQDPARIYMVTDSRSEKPAQIDVNPAAEICWYFTRTREQFRLHGKLSLSGEDSTEQAQRHEIWSSMSESARDQFYWPDPGKPLGKAEESHGDDNGDLPPANFLLLDLQIDRVDHLCLRGNPQSRWLTLRDSNGDWVSQAVNP